MALKKAYWDKNLQAAKDDPCVIDAMTDWAIRQIKALPSAERHGKWVDGKRMGVDGASHWFRQCSECLYEREDVNEDKDTLYCPHCGARMVNEDE